jgi:hypothetical protein
MMLVACPLGDEPDRAAHRIGGEVEITEIAKLRAHLAARESGRGWPNPRDLSVFGLYWFIRNFREAGFAKIGYTTIHCIMVSSIVSEVYDSIAPTGLAGVCRSAPGQPGHH